MGSRRTLRTLAQVALVAFLFAQAALAVAGCDFGKRAAAQAVVLANAQEHPCHEEGGDSAANLCVAHCVTQTQSLEKPFWKSPATAPVPVLVLVAVSPPVAPAPAFHLSIEPAGPPRHILFRTLLI